MLHTKFHQNQSSGSWKEDVESVLPYMGMAATWSCHQHYVDDFFYFFFLYLQAYIQNLAEKWPSGY